jgi:hypothetical protein
MELRSIALATTALVAIATVAAPAHAGQYMGKVNLGFGFAWEDIESGGESTNDLDYTTMHGSASVNVPYSEWVNLQFDIFGSQSLDEAWDNNCNNGCGSFYSGFGAGAHLNYRDPMTGALGVFGTVGRSNVAGRSGTWSTHFVVFAAGIEGEYYCNAWTLSAQVGFLDTDVTGYGLMREAGFARAGVAYYPSKRLKIAGSVGYMAGDTSSTVPTSDVDVVDWNFSIEYLFGKSIPVSTYLEYRGHATEAFSSPVWEFDRHEVRGGVRFMFGGTGDDLKQADREGAGMQSPDIITLPRFGGGSS